MIFVPENATLGEACVLGVGEDGRAKGIKGEPGSEPGRVQQFHCGARGRVPLRTIHLSGQ